MLCLAADIYEKVSEELEKDGILDCECIGGGRIRHDAQAKKIHVYGYSMVRRYREKRPGGGGGGIFTKGHRGLKRLQAADCYDVS